MVGSMRPSTAVSADGPLNLYNAVGVAADPQARGRGVLVVMNDWIHAAHSLTKTSTTAVQTFMSPVRGLVGVAAYGKNDFYSSPPWKHTTQSEFDVSQVTPKLPRVDIIYACADMSPDLIDAAVASGAKGIVIAGVGNGNMNKASLVRRRQCREEGRRRRAQLARGDGHRRPQRRGQRRRAGLRRVGRAEPAEGAAVYDLLRAGASTDHWFGCDADHRGWPAREGAAGRDLTQRIAASADRRHGRSRRGR